MRETDRRDGFEIGTKEDGVLVFISELELQTYPGNPDALFREAVERARNIRRVKRFARLLAEEA